MVGIFFVGIFLVIDQSDKKPSEREPRWGNLIKGMITFTVLPPVFQKKEAVSNRT